jgi:hypothetical protein
MRQKEPKPQQTKLKNPLSIPISIPQWGFPSTKKLDQQRREVVTVSLQNVLKSNFHLNYYLPISPIVTNYLLVGSKIVLSNGVVFFVIEKSFLTNIKSTLKLVPRRP